MKIAIQGHPTRGKEVIQILESLGGKNVKKLEGTYETFYYVDDKNEISDGYRKNFPSTYRLYTLGEFKKEFPFKIGDEVIFPVKIGWASGKVTGLTYVEGRLKYEIDHRIAGYCYIEPNKLSLYPMKEERNITLTLDKAKEWYNKGGELKEIALQAFTENELNPLPRSWKEFCENYPVKNGECIIESEDRISVSPWAINVRRLKTWIPSKKSAEAHLAMIQLEQLRDCWRQGWTPKTHSAIYAIKFSIHGLSVYQFNSREFLSFPTKEMAEEFLKCFRDLIEKAGDLI